MGKVLWWVCMAVITCVLIYWSGCAARKSTTSTEQYKLETEPYEAQQKTEPPTPGEPILIRHERNKKVYHIYSDPNAVPCPCGKNSDTESYQQYLEITDDIKALQESAPDTENLEAE